MITDVKLDWQPIEEPLPQEGFITGYARGLELSLNKLGIEAEYTTIMGDIGQAFVIQGEDQNKIKGAVDIGWWPLEPLCLVRLPFLSQTVGREIKQIRIPDTDRDLLQKDPKKAYELFFKEEIHRNLNNGTPCIVFNQGCQYIITGQDQSDSPLTGIWVNQKDGYDKVHRIENPFCPWLLLTIGNSCEKLGRKNADIRALDYAIALHTEEALYPKDQDQKRFNLQNSAGYVSWNWHTGEETLHIWIKCLEGLTNIGEARWHANSFGYLKNNKIAAIDYLTQMTGRYSSDINSHLEKAIQEYEKIVAMTKIAKPQKETIGLKDERFRLIGILNEILNSEENAIEALSKALKNLQTLN